MFQESKTFTYDEVTVTVVPLGFAHLRKFSDKLVGLFSVIKGMEVPADAESKARQAEILISQAMPIILNEGFDIFEACVKIEGTDTPLQDFPHNIIPDLVEAWVIMSFGDEGKWKPWVTMVKSMMSRDWTSGTPSKS
jgi:hypothetical protein